MRSSGWLEAALIPFLTAIPVTVMIGAAAFWMAGVRAVWAAMYGGIAAILPALFWMDYRKTFRDRILEHLPPGGLPSRMMVTRREIMFSFKVFVIHAVSATAWALVARQIVQSHTVDTTAVLMWMLLLLYNVTLPIRFLLNWADSEAERDAELVLRGQSDSTQLG